MSTQAIVQVRLGSTRLPGKVLAEIEGRPAIWHLMEQLKHARTLDSVVLATTTLPQDDRLADYAGSRGWTVFRGDAHDVLDRYYRAALAAGCSGRDAIVRVTGDDILADPEVVDRVVELYRGARPPVAHASNNRTPGFPYGADVEVFSFDALAAAWREATEPYDREHVTPFIRTRPDRFPWAELVPEEDRSDIRLSIDYPADLAFVRALVRALRSTADPPYHLRDVARCIERHDIEHEGSEP